MALSNHDIERILICASEADISDIYITPGQPVFWKRYGDISSLRSYVPTVNNVWNLLRRTTSDAVYEEFTAGNDITYIWSLDNCKFRFTVYRQGGEPSFSIRTINIIKENYMDNIGEANIIFDFLYDTGLVVVAGANGSGKTKTIRTALYSLKNKNLHITTLQRANECYNYTCDCFINHREHGKDFKDWNTAINTAFSSRSDVVYIGHYDVSMANNIIKLAKHSLVLLELDAVSLTDVKNVLADYDNKLLKRFDSVLKLTMFQKLVDNNETGGLKMTVKTIPPKDK